MGQLLTNLIGEFDFLLEKKTPYFVYADTKHTDTDCNNNTNNNNHNHHHHYYHNQYSNIDLENKAMYTCVGNKSSLTNITQQFETLQEKAMKFGLDSLVDPIKDTVESLKDLELSRTSSTVSQPLPNSHMCNCRIWGPDSLTPDGEWICSCGSQCHCDKVDWATVPHIPSRDLNTRSYKPADNSLSDTKTNEIGVKSIYPGKCESAGFLCKCDCHSSQVKGKGSCIASDIVTSSEDEPTMGSSRDVIVNVKKSSERMLKNFEINDGIRQSNGEVEVKGENENEEEPGNTGENVLKEVEDKKRIIKEKKKHTKAGLMCACGSEHTIEGEVQICRCGCGQLVQIVDDVDKISCELETLGFCCNCTRHMPVNYLKNISKLSLDKFNASAMITAVELLQMKCRVKDGLIAVLAEKLRKSSDIKEIAENLMSPYLPKIHIDFDRSLLYEFLKPQLASENHSEEQLSQDDSVPAPKNFRVVKPILQSLYLAWDLPDELSNIRGYEILVNGVITSRMRSATRSQTIVTSLDLTKPIELTLYSVSTNGYTSEPLTITFPARKFD